MSAPGEERDAVFCEYTVSVPELLAQDALVQAVAGIEQHRDRESCDPCVISTARTSRTSSWSATAATGRLSASSTSIGDLRACRAAARRASGVAGTG